MRRTIGSVMDDINEWNGPNGAVYYVTAFFTNREVLSVGKKDLDAAMEVKGLLQEVIEVPQEFILEPKGQTKKGDPKWNLRAFGPPEGVWTYNTIKGASQEVGGGNGHGAQGEPATIPSVEVHETPGRLPTNIDASIRASVAVKAAANSVETRPDHASEDAANLLRLADVIDAWLAKKSGISVPDSDEGADGGTANRAEPGEASAPSSTNGDCPPHDLDLDVAPKAMRYPCRRCNAWIKPTMAAEEVEEMAT